VRVVVERSDCISGAPVTSWEVAIIKSPILIVEDDFDIANMLKITSQGRIMKLKSLRVALRRWRKHARYFQT
jgi:hypothetical protein